MVRCRRIAIYSMMMQRSQRQSRRPAGVDSGTQEELIRRSQERGYLEIKDGRIRYNCRRRYEDDFTDPEEHVRAALFAWLILEREYSNSQIDVEVTVPRRTPQIGPTCSV